jgi:hypothetical protein
VDPNDSTPTDAWDKEDIDACTMIITILESRLITQVAQCPKSKDMWDKLMKVHSDSSLFNRHHVVHQFYSYKVAPLAGVPTA